MERMRVPFERTEITSGVINDLTPVFRRSIELLSGVRKVNNTQIYDETYAVNRLAIELVSNDKPDYFSGNIMTERRMAFLEEIAGEIGKPRTINDFQKLKYGIMCITYDPDYLLMSAFPSLKEKLGSGIISGRKIFNNYPVTRKIARNFFSIANGLEIIQGNRMKHEWNEGVVSIDQMWRRIEGDSVRESPRPVIHPTLEHLTKSLEDFRKVNYLKEYVPRVGLIFGDFRVGFHPGHSELAEHAKLALGREGRLIAVTPTKDVIQEVNHKDHVWDDEIRVALIANDRSINDVLVSDMPESYRSHPSDHWANVWNEIKPDLVFLGEQNHPLEPAYRYQAERIGGILLIDDSIRRSVRSGDLISV